MIQIKAKFLLTLLLITAAFSLTFIASCSVSTANLSDAKVCTSLNGSECASDNSTVPASSTVIYCSANLKNAPAGTKVTFTWKKGGDNIASVDLEGSSGVVYSNLNTGGSLEPGKYSVTIKINSDNSQPVTKEFTVE
jgi:plastocyanin